jgi:hypothetical protein
METRLMKSLRKTIEYLFYLFVFLLPWQTKLILRPADTNFNEISLYANHLLLIIILILFFVYKFREKKNREQISSLWCALIIGELFVLMSFFFAADQVLAFYHYVLFVGGVGLFCLMREGTETVYYKEGKLDKFKVIYSFLAGIFLQAALGIYQFLAQKSFVCKYFGLAQHDAYTPGTSVIETFSGRWLRAYGGFDHPNIFGGVLVIALILTGYLLARKKVIRSKQEIGESIFLFIFYFIALISLFFTFSRAAWLAYGAGLLILLVALIIQKDRWILGRFLALLFFSIIMLFIIAYPYRDLLHVRIAGETRLEQKSLSERQEYLIQAKDLIKENLLFGVGTGNYVSALERQDQNKKPIWIYQPVHNVLLLLWAESGVFAFVSFLAFLFFLIKKNRRAVFSGAVFMAIIILLLLDHWLLSLPFGVLFLFFILGLI